MKRVILLIGLAAVILLAVMVGNTLRVPAPPPPPTQVGTGIRFDEAAAAERLAGAVRFPTVSYASGGPIDTAAFLGLHQYFANSFPLVHATLTRELVNGLSLLYTWKGTDSTLPSVVLMGHMDVVPVPAQNLPEWTQPPFSGAIADGFV